MKETKTIVSFFYKRRIFLLAVCFAFIVGLLFFWAVKAAGDGRFFLLHEDEVIYYGSAKLFAGTNSAQAESCIDENVSKIGRMNWYGPGYHWLYGSLFKIFGEHGAIFPWTHFVLALATLALIFLFPIKLESKLLFAISLALTHQFCVYIFTFFPEPLILFLAMVLTLLFILLYQAKEQRLKNIYLVAFVTCVLLFMLWRITFIFWLAGPIALAENRRSLALRIVMFAVGVVISLVYMKLFIAPPFAGEMHKIDHLYTFRINDFIYQTLRTFFANLKVFLTPGPSVLKIILGLVITAVVAFAITKNKLILAGLLISGCIIGVMMAYYAVDPFYFVKQSGMLMPLLLGSIVIGITSKTAAYVLAAVLLLTFPSPFRKVETAIQEGRSAHAHYENHGAFRKALAEIPSFITPESTVILWDYREYDYGYSAEALLPFATRGNRPILYTTNIVDASATPEERFRLHNRLKVDYILSHHELSWPSVQQVHTTEFYHLYKRLDN